MRQGLLHGVRRTELRLLLDEDQVGLTQCLPNLFPTKPVDDYDALWLQAAGRSHDVTQQRAPGKKVQNLRLRGKHPRPLAGGQDDDVEAHGIDMDKGYEELRGAVARGNYRTSPEAAAMVCSS